MALRRFKGENMKPFDLEKALAGAPVVTRAGVYVTDVYLPESSDDGYCVTATVDGETESFTEHGIYNVDRESDLDLFMADTEHDSNDVAFKSLPVFDQLERMRQRAEDELKAHEHLQELNLQHGRQLTVMDIYSAFLAGAFYARVKGGN
jgi:hypothetical protein